MGCDIHVYVEQRQGDGAWRATPLPVPDDGPFGTQCYAVFAFLAGVRNYVGITPLAEPRGLPADVSDDVRAHAEVWGMDAHSHSWFTIAELAAVDYDQEVEDRRVTIGRDGGRTAEPGGGKRMTLRDFLGLPFMNDLGVLSQMDKAVSTRAVFWFDN